jgi:hypothetical protein
MSHFTLVFAALAIVGTGAASAANASWRFGARYNVLASDAPPANDMHGYGLTLRHAGATGWGYGLALELYEYDYEEPYKVLDIARPPGTEPIDGSNESTVVSAWIEKELGRPQGWRWFWTAGLGYAFLTVDTVTGPTAGGGQFDIRTDAEDELQLMASFGVRRRLSARWSAEVALLAQHHFTDYTLRDSISGRTGSIGSQTPIGISFGFFFE